MKKTKYLYDIIDSTMIYEKDYREVFDDAVQFAYGESVCEFYEKDIDAIMVNNIRHNCSNYDQNLKQVYKINRTDDDYKQYKNSVLHRIASTYPSLEDECNRQKRKLDMVEICKR